MWPITRNKQSLSTIMAYAYSLKKRGYYQAAQSLLASALEEYPEHPELKALSQRITLLQKIKALDGIVE